MGRHPDPQMLEEDPVLREELWSQKGGNRNLYMVTQSVTVSAIREDSSATDRKGFGSWEARSRPPLFRRAWRRGVRQTWVETRGLAGRPRCEFKVKKPQVCVRAVSRGHRRGEKGGAWTPRGRRACWGRCELLADTTAQSHLGARPSVRVDSALGMPGAEAVGQPCWGVWAEFSLHLGPWVDSWPPSLGLSGWLCE